MTPVTHCHSAGRTSFSTALHPILCKASCLKVHLLPEVKPLKEDNNNPALSIVLSCA